MICLMPLKLTNDLLKPKIAKLNEKDYQIALQALNNTSKEYGKELELKIIGYLKSAK